MLAEVRKLEKELGVEPFRFDHFPEDPVERVKCIKYYMLSLKEKAFQNNKKKEVQNG